VDPLDSQAALVGLPASLADPAGHPASSAVHVDRLAYPAAPMDLLASRVDLADLLPAGAEAAACADPLTAAGGQPEDPLMVGEETGLTVSKFVLSYLNLYYCSICAKLIYSISDFHSYFPFA
jgi:hypothetical protein